MSLLERPCQRRAKTSSSRPESLGPSSGFLDCPTEGAAPIRVWSRLLSSAVRIVSANDGSEVRSGTISGLARHAVISGSIHPVDVTVSITSLASWEASPPRASPAISRASEQSTTLCVPQGLASALARRASQLPRSPVHAAASALNAANSPSWLGLAGRSIGHELYQASRSGSPMKAAAESEPSRTRPDCGHPRRLELRL